MCVSIVRTIRTPAALGLVEQRLDRVRRIDEHRDAGLLVSDEVTGTAEIVVQELVEDHEATVAPGPAIDPEVVAAGETAKPTRLPPITRTPTIAATTASRGAASAPRRRRRGGR